jgi:hypothetical protein
MFGLTAIGMVHMAISVVAVLSGVVCLVRAGAIDGVTIVGKVYFWTTLLTCLTAFGIFAHGGFGKGHALAVLTLVELAVATGAERYCAFGKVLSRYIATVSYSATLFSHLIPGVTEATTRLPLGAPLFSGANDPELQKLTQLMLVMFLLGAAVQVRMLFSQRVLSTRLDSKPFVGSTSA